jgi:F-type H+-transporting ATPase subunit b
MENLGIDIKLLIAQAINFGIFLFIFQKFISKPFLAYLKKQKEEEELRAEFAEELETRKEKLDAEDAKLEKERKKKLEKAITEAKTDAEVVKAEIIETAHKEAATIVEKGKEQIAQERKELYKDIRQQITSVSMLVVEKALREYLTDDAQKKITQNIVKHIPDETKLAN